MKKFGLIIVLVTGSAWASVAQSGLPFVDDDYAKALGTARQRHLPLFVEVSAPW
jgi:hypothetical protein